LKQAEPRLWYSDSVPSFFTAKSDVTRMEDLKDLMETFGNEALEANTKIASVAIILPTGQVAYQSSNWDLSDQTDVLLGVLDGATSFKLNNLDFSVGDSNVTGLVGINPSGMGSVILVPFQGGLLVVYVMPSAELQHALDFLIEFAPRFNGMI
jgi:hypothetical protein